MKPCNFPGRKNARRVRALETISKNISDAETKEEKKILQAKFDVTNDRIMSEEEARGIRTKKYRVAKKKK